jgi:alpha-L-fucosidase
MTAMLRTHLVRCAAVLLAVSPVLPAAEVVPPDLQWWRDARFGMFIHWGPSSISGKEISWSRAGIGKEKYDALYKEFNPVKFDAGAWVAAAKAAGMRYIVLTAKHCDGFLLWPSKTIDYNISNTPFKRDVVAELSAASRKAGIPFCVYFAPGDWKDPDCRNPKTNDVFVKRMHAQLTELLTQYGRIPLIWFDFDGWPNPSEPRETATLVRKLQPGVIITNRLEALHSDESHGRVGPWGDYATPEQFVGGYCDRLPWETCMTIGQQWSWKPDEKIKSLKQCLTTLVSTVGGDGNLLFNVGPRPDGEIEPSQVARIREMGAWLSKNGEAVYGTRGGPYHPTASYAATRTKDAIYLSVFQFTGGKVTLPALPAKIVSASLLDGSAVNFEQAADKLVLSVPPAGQDPAVSVVKLRIEGDPLTIPAIPPPSSSGSLAYRKPARVSSSIAPEFIHSAYSAIDDDPSTCWVPGRDEAIASGMAGRKFDHLQKLPTHPVWLRTGWLAVDIGQPMDVSRAILREKIVPTSYSPVSSWTIEYLKGDIWHVAARGTVIGKSREVQFEKPVNAARFRLSIEALGRPAITEFQLFP